MRLEIQSGQAWISGKYSEQAKCEKVAQELTELLNDEPVFDESDEDDNTADLGVNFDKNDYTIEQVKELYKIAKKNTNIK